jgi:hypothetical protein
MTDSWAGEDALETSKNLIKQVELEHENSRRTHLEFAARAVKHAMDVIARNFIASYKYALNKHFHYVNLLQFSKSGHVVENADGTLDMIDLEDSEDFAGNSVSLYDLSHGPDRNPLFYKQAGVTNLSEAIVAYFQELMPTGIVRIGYRKDDRVTNFMFFLDKDEEYKGKCRDATKYAERAVPHVGYPLKNVIREAPAQGFVKVGGAKKKFRKGKPKGN